MAEILIILIAVFIVVALFVYIFRKGTLSLHAAAAWGDAETVKELLEGGANIEARDKHNTTHPPSIELLVLATPKP